MPKSLLMALIAMVSLGTRAGAQNDSEFAARVLNDVGYRTACGPIACFAALRAIGASTSLEEVVSLCRWREGETTTLETMRAALSGWEGVDCAAVRLSPDQLAEYLSPGERAAILAVRKRSRDINHAVCAVAADADMLVAVDYPELAKWIHVEELADIWDGEALLISRSAAPSASRALLAGALPGLGLAFAVLILGKPWPRLNLRRRETPGNSFPPSANQT